MEIFGVPIQAFLGQLLLGLVNGSFYAMLSLGLAVIFGLLNIINFTHGAQYMMGAFCAWFLLQWAGVGYWWSLVIAPIVVGVVGIVIERRAGVIGEERAGQSTYMLAAASKKSGITNLRQIKDRKEPTWIVGGNNLIFDYYGIKVEDLKAKGGGIMPQVGTGPGMVTREKRASADVFIGTGLLANTPEQRSWYEASQLNDLRFLDMEEPLLVKLAAVPGYERGTVPLALFRGVDRPIPTVMRPNHLIYVRDDAPDAFAYAVAKALDEHRQLFQVQLEPWYYDPQTVAVSKVIPMHPGAMKYYRERGYVR